jgi:hypothetical protein
MPLSVISALIQLDIDPLGGGCPARRFAEGDGGRGLGADDRSVPIGHPQLSHNLAVSKRLVDLLPEPGQVASPSRKQSGATDKKYVHVVMLLAFSPLGQHQSPACCDFGAITCGLLS